MIASKGYKLVGVCLLGYLVLKFLDLHLLKMTLNHPLDGIVYSYTVMIIIAVISAYWGIKTQKPYTKLLLMLLNSYQNKYYCFL